MTYYYLFMFSCLLALLLTVLYEYFELRRPK